MVLLNPTKFCILHPKTEVEEEDEEKNLLASVILLASVFRSDS